jgi:hypothetical protein
MYRHSGLNLDAKKNEILHLILLIQCLKAIWILNPAISRPKDAGNKD